MLNTDIIIINTDDGKREFLISPILFQSKQPPDLKGKKILKLYFYENWMDEEYKANLAQEVLDESFKTDEYVINFGQDFSKFYVGYIIADFENQTFGQWNGESSKVNAKDAKILQEALTNPAAERRRVTVFTPTRPSDFNFGKLKYLF